MPRSRKHTAVPEDVKERHSIQKDIETGEVVSETACVFEGFQNYSIVLQRYIARHRVVGMEQVSTALFACFDGGRDLLHHVLGCARQTGHIDVAEQGQAAPNNESEDRPRRVAPLPRGDGGR